MCKATLLAVVFVAAMGALATAQCACEQATPIEKPSCYTAFWASELVRFRLVVPGDYFFCCPDCEAPLVTGWRVETMSGAIVYHESFVEVPRGHWYIMGWNQRDASGNAVSAGFYKLVVETTSTSEFESYIQIAPSSCCWGFFGCCPRLPSYPCGIAVGQPYIKIIQVERHWSARCSVVLSAHFGLDCCP
jgi:hypothetical protein